MTQGLAHKPKYALYWSSVGDAAPRCGASNDY